MQRSRVVASLWVAAIVFAISWLLGRSMAPSEIVEVEGVVQAVSEGGDSLCIGDPPPNDPLDDSFEQVCASPLVAPGQTLPAVGTRVTGGWAIARTSAGRGVVWVYVIPTTNN